MTTNPCPQGVWNHENGCTCAGKGATSTSQANFPSPPPTGASPEWVQPYLDLSIQRDELKASCGSGDDESGASERLAHVNALMSSWVVKVQHQVEDREWRSAYREWMQWQKGLREMAAAVSLRTVRYSDYDDEVQDWDARGAELAEWAFRLLHKQAA